MKFRFLFVGRTRDAGFRAGIGEYARRIGRYVPAEIVVLKDVPVDAPAAVRDHEGPHVERLKTALGRGAGTGFAVVLDERGELFTSLEFADFLADRWRGTHRQMSFLVGGPFGIPAAVCREADLLWSLSPLTLTHEMARLLMLEQIYRAFTIIRGETYHY
ncbi:MAG: 23S rRNA (pseudouridine(1915)-N(3))-methyltransferase RlmH [Deltaproteobacteria bacterium]|nr:23S rRNA (pseudouridine(1915)-N(3))-methyltransferase RlmH [Candidatus Anaeroferrophillacea bacterium]